MIRDICNIDRNLENSDNIDILQKKRMIKEILLSDPDLLEVLGQLPPQHNPYEDPVTHRAKPGLSDDELKEYQEICDYNEAIEHEQIVDYLKLNNLQKEVLNFVMFDIYDERLDYDNRGFKRQYLITMVVVNEDDMVSEYGAEMFEQGAAEKTSLGMYNFQRVDLISYILKDLFNYSNALGAETKCYSDEPKIIDSRYYCREIRFVATLPNVVVGHGGIRNKYDPEL